MRPSELGRAIGPEPTDPSHRLRRSALVSGVVILTLLGAMAAVCVLWLDLRPWAVAQSLAVFVAAALWLQTQLHAHLPQPRLHPANQVTLIRLALTALLAGWVGQPLDAAAWAPTLVAALALTLDGLDGWLARRGGWASAFGARFDMETDALLVMVLSALVWDLDKAGAWVLLAGLARYLFVASARIWSWLARPLAPTRERQTFCVIQVAALLLALAPPLQPPISAWVAAIGLAGLSYSFGIDVLWLWRRRAGL